MPSPSQSLDDILFFQSESGSSNILAGWQIASAKAAITQLVSDIVGADEYPEDARDVTYDLMIRSGLRASQRQTAKSLGIEL
jgi:hypothetical protein